ncbi:FAD-dependent thymidylate synthase [Aeoliella sp.]|uniref:FAD-dependent thymidylate synthase n=1 Tax=Aeoliella sp. TaxID=2795800 RepID=UPI003CCC3874
MTNTTDLRGESIKVLDDGFVRVVDTMGDDSSIVQAARISYGAGTKRVSEDRGLIRYLMRNRHTTPFEMCEVKLHVRVPMDAWRQWIRHRTANVNEYSTRYSEAIDAKQKTTPESWRVQSRSNKQGSGDYLAPEIGKMLSDREAELHQLDDTIYQERLDAGVAREQARKDLPLSTYTEAYWKIDLHNLFHFLALRMDAHAQYEIRSYANVIGNEIVAKWVPMAWEAFVDYRLEAMQLSRLDQVVINLLLAGKVADATEAAKSFGWITEDGDGLKANRERAEFEIKAAALGLTPTWL